MATVADIRRRLTEFDFRDLFIEELGWDYCQAAPLLVEVDGAQFTLTPVAEKRAMVAYRCDPGLDGAIPDSTARRRIDREVTKAVHEHLIIFTDAGQSTQTWQWVRRQAGRPAAVREHTVHPGQTGEALAQRLSSLAISIVEEEELAGVTDVVGRVRSAFDVDRVTRRFYDRFKAEHAAFLKFIRGIGSEADEQWYASLMLNRLMFIYFFQKKGFLDNDVNYLRSRMRATRERIGNDRFHSFYRHFLLRLFHDGLGQPDRNPVLEELLGQVPFLNGGLFEVHRLEHEYDIEIADQAFEQLFDFFDQYSWHLDERPLRSDNEINPDVLGYIFEKYINQKQMGAYYTKEDITEYIAKNTVIPFLLDSARKNCAVAFRPDGAVWGLLQSAPDRYIYEAVRKGVDLPLPDDIAEGVGDVSKRDGWNRPADPGYALPTETWREHVARRTRCLDLREKLRNGEVHDVNDLITLNLDIRQFAQDVIETTEGPELLRAMYHAVRQVSILDPACGSGAFLFAALSILEPLYEACLERMDGFLSDLDRSIEKPHPKKFSDFRESLEQAAKHASQRYFILKSIVLDNLYGVDIMEEAVEICKLRLFLKLVAQLERYDQVEPLPDIDFNVRSGNTLVGFTSLEAVRQAMTMKGKDQHRMLSAEDEAALKRIEEDAEVADWAFQQFKDSQSAREMKAGDLAAGKELVRESLHRLQDQLDRYMAAEYGVADGNDAAHRRWKNSHQPYHWFVEFYGIMRRGGFDVIIGNPPFVEYRNVRKTYQIRGYSTEDCGNLYAFFWERCIHLALPSGRVGMIVPVASLCTPRYASLQQLFGSSGTTVVSTYNDRPSKLFEGLEHARLAIILHDLSADTPGTYSTGYSKWYSRERDALLRCLSYVDTTDCGTDAALAKIGTPIELSILSKLRAERGPIAAYLTPNGSASIQYTRKLSYFVQVLDFVPAILDERGEQRSPSELKTLAFRDAQQRDVFLSVLNSSLFYWMLTCYSDCRNLNQREIGLVAFDMNRAPSETKVSLVRLGRKLMSDLQEHSTFRAMTYANLGTLRIQCTFPRLSKSVIDQIDQVLASHYGLSDEEADFVINYDIKYRMGQAKNEEE